MEDDEFGSNPVDDMDEESYINDEPKPKVEEEKPKASTPTKKEEAEPKKLASHIKIDSSNLDEYLSEINRMATIMSESNKTLKELEKSFTIVHKLKDISELDVGKMQESFDYQLKNLDIGLFVKKTISKEVEGIIEIVKSETEETMKNLKSEIEETMANLKKESKEAMANLKKESNETIETVKEIVEDELIELSRSYKNQNEILKNIVNSDWVLEKLAEPQEKMTFAKKLGNFAKNSLIVIMLVSFGYGISFLKDGSSEQQQEPKQGQKIKKVFPAGTSVLDTKTGQTKQASSDMNIEVVEMDEYYLYKNRYKFEKF